MSNFVSLTRLSLQMFDKMQTELFPISGFLVKSLINTNDITSEPKMIFT